MPIVQRWVVEEPNCVEDRSAWDIVGMSLISKVSRREGRKNGERKHGNREAASFPLQNSSVGALGYTNPFQAGKS